MSGTGLHWGSAMTTAAWPGWTDIVQVGAELTYRGPAEVRLGRAGPGEVVVPPATMLENLQRGQTDHAVRYFALLAEQLGGRGLDGPVVVAVPARTAADTAHRLHEVLTGEVRLPVTRVVTAPIAAAAHAFLSGALEQAPVSAPVIVVDVDDDGATVTMTHGSAGRLRPTFTTPVDCPSGTPDRGGIIGRAVAAAAADAGLTGGPLRLLMLGNAGLGGEVASAAQYAHRYDVAVLASIDPATAAAHGAAAIAAGRVEVGELFRFGVRLSSHVINSGRLEDVWPRLAGPDELTPGPSPAEVTVDVAGGDTTAQVRLLEPWPDGTVTDGEIVGVPLDPPPPPGRYQVGVVLEAGGPALAFTRPGHDPLLFPIPLRKAPS
ncbi:hypothetical protein KOI35_12815 [Actinoplanes bogorensis]|uniref:Uncharacterized protein n=1 Tax=Paractinoplanes bogorensis TaxID=1610840 RepID=A0ABS5YLN3_9ACTN|nr:hypothetical protein [Actinoplanes bogorensis]MBU2664378.1 hypothetical protein [Actinoplanes bogorensis]